MSNRRTTARIMVTAIGVLAALAMVAPPAVAQTRSQAFYRTTEGANLAGSVTCGSTTEGTYTVDTEVAVTLVAAGAIDPSGTVEVPAGTVTTFTVSGDNTLSLVGEDVETLFDNSGCSGTLTITAASSGSNSVSVRNELRSSTADRAPAPSRRTRGVRP